MKVKSVAAGEFKTHCLKLMDEVEATRRPIVITKHRRPVARLVPVAAEVDDFFGRMAHCKIVGDIESPIWDAEVARDNADPD